MSLLVGFCSYSCYQRCPTIVIWTEKISNLSCPYCHEEILDSETISCPHCKERIRTNEIEEKIKEKEEEEDEKLKGKEEFIG